VFECCLRVFGLMFFSYGATGFIRRNVYKYVCFKGCMFGWLFGNRTKIIEEKAKEGFEAVRKDYERVGTWIKHLDERDKQLFDIIQSLKIELSSIREEIEGVKEAVSLVDFETKNKQLFKKSAVLHKQTAVGVVGEPVQTAVQTGNLYQILQNLTSNERLVVFTLLNAGEGMKLSYEDLARLLGKERSTVRGQINMIKQKSEGLIQEIVEPNGKKRVHIDEEVRVKLLKYAKVRVKEDKKPKKEEEK